MARERCGGVELIKCACLLIALLCVYTFHFTHFTLHL